MISSLTGCIRVKNCRRNIEGKQRTISLFTCAKQKWILSLEGRILSSNLKSNQKPLIDWKKAGRPKKSTLVLVM